MRRRRSPWPFVERRVRDRVLLGQLGAAALAHDPGDGADEITNGFAASSIESAVAPSIGVAALRNALDTNARLTEM
jgi:hypothetical protein